MRKREKKGSIVYQARQALFDQMAEGESKHEAKRKGEPLKIYMWETLKCYRRHTKAFVEWCRAVYGCRLLEECYQYAPEYMEGLRNYGYSSSTLKLIGCSIAKMYRCSMADLQIITPVRKRADITRSRGEKPSDIHFSEENNRDLVDFCRAIGPRKWKELKHIKGNQLLERDGVLYITGIKGKGGRMRDAPVLPEYNDIVRKLCEGAGNNSVFLKIPGHADVHSYRAEYAKEWYKRLARPVNSIPKKDRYYCRRDRAGIVYDRVALRKVSSFLGHTRESVVVEHYLF